MVSNHHAMLRRPQSIQRLLVRIASLNIHHLLVKKTTVQAHITHELHPLVTCRFHLWPRICHRTRQIIHHNTAILHHLLRMANTHTQLHLKVMPQTLETLATIVATNHHHMIPEISHKANIRNSLRQDRELLLLVDTVDVER